MLETRVVLRPISPGSMVLCHGCGMPIMYKAKLRPRPTIVLCNIYEGDRWDRLEEFHPECYDDRYGKPVSKTYNIK